MHFARIHLSCQPAGAWTITFNDSLGLMSYYGDAMTAGIQLAIDEYRKHADIAYAIHVERLEYTVVDTRPDAVKCAAAMAAWVGLGQDESLARLDLSTFSRNVTAKKLRSLSQRI